MKESNKYPRPRSNMVEYYRESAREAEEYMLEMINKEGVNKDVLEYAINTWADRARKAIGVEAGFLLNYYDCFSKKV